jgi:hypothetical protein
VVALAVSQLDDGALGAVVTSCALGLLALVVALAGVWAGGAWLAQGLLGAGYLTGVLLRGPDLDPAAPAVAAGVLLIGELTHLALDLRAGGLEARALAGRLVAVAAMGAGAAALGWLLLAAWTLPLPAGAATTVLGVAAALAAIALVAGLARRVR